MNTLDYIHAKSYRPDIDGLRAIAIIWVILCHAFPSVFGGGYIGVDIFFVISGYLISSILFKNQNAGGIKFLDFYAKRARRIFPALIFVILGGLIIGGLLLSPQEYKEMGASAFFGSVFFENFKLARGVDYFGLEIARNPFMHLWSLAIEEQFYLLFPITLLALWKLLNGRVGFVLLVLVALSFFTGLYFQPINDSGAYFWPHCRFWQLGAGVLLAYVHFRAPVNDHCQRLTLVAEQYGSALSIIAAGAFLVCLLTFGSVSSEYPGAWALVPTLATVFMIAAGKNAWFNRVVLSLPSTIYIGWLSYPLYLWHWVFISVAFSIYAGQIPLDAKLIAIALTVLMAFISFKFVELPIRQKKADKKMLISTLIVLLIAGLAGGAVSKLDGAPQRLNDKDYATLTNIKRADHIPEVNQCPGNPNFFCWSQTGKADGNVLVIGNSHAQHLMNTFDKAAPDFARVDVFAAGGTRPLEGVVQRFTEKQLIRDSKAHSVLAAVKESKAKVVVVSQSWGHVNENEEVFLLDGSSDTFGRVFTRTFENILAGGKKVVFLIDNPSMPNEIGNCLQLRPVSLVAGHCTIARSTYNKQVQSQRAHFEKWAKMYPEQIFVIDAGSALCDDNECSMVDENGSALYWDGHHLTIEGGRKMSEYVWKHLTPILQKALEGQSHQ